MVETLSATELRKLKKQRDGEEDPLIVAQRFLNIYRQLHIFTDEKKQAFNQMLLELKPEIKAVFATIPGGVVLQDYIEELEEKNGTSKAAPTPTAATLSDAADEEVSKAKILATALAEAQIQASSKMQQMAQPPIATTGSAPIHTTSKVELGKDFAQELSGALTMALKDSNLEQRNEVKEIVQTLGNTQLEIIKILQTENQERKTETSNLTKMLLASQQQLGAMVKQQKEEKGKEETAAKEASNVQNSNANEESNQLLKLLLNAQMQTNKIISQQEKREAARYDTSIDAGMLMKALATSQQQVAKIMYLSETNAQTSSKETVRLFESSQQQFNQLVEILQASQKENNLEIVKAVQDGQKELAQYLVNNNVIQNIAPTNTAANNNANNIQINNNNVDYSKQLNLIAERLGKVSASNNFDKTMEKIISAQSQIYQDAIAAQTKELGSIITLALKESQNSTTQQILQALNDNSRRYNAYAPPAATNTATPIEDIIPEEVIEPVNDEPAAEPIYDAEYVPEEQPDLAVHERDPQIAETDSQAAEPVIENTEDTIPAADTVTEPKKKKKKKKKKNKDANVNPTTAVSDTAAPNNSEVDISNELQNLDDAPLDLSLEEIEKPAVVEPAYDEGQNDFADASLIPDLLPEESPMSLETSDNNDWGFGNTAEDISAEPTAGNAWDWEPENETSATSEPTDSPEEITDDEYIEEEPDGEEGTDWEWEYVDEDGNSFGKLLADGSLTPISNNSSIYSGDLFFKQNVYENDNFGVGTAYTALDGNLVTIKDSLDSEKDDDPYKNSNIKC